MKEIVGAVIGSVITGVLGFIAISSMGLLEKHIKDNQIHQVASDIVNTGSYRGVLLQKMTESNNFIGPEGPQGQKGDQGVQGKQGPAWKPRVHTDNLSNDKNNPRDMEKNLGTHAFCALARSGTSHASQACTCTVTGSANSQWKLSLSLAENVNGRCNCGAICIDP